MKTYNFRPVERCDMCESDRFKILGMRLSTSQGLRPKSATGIAVTVKKCRDCGLIFADPLPIPENIDDHYGMPPEDYWKTADFTAPPDYMAEEIATARRLLGHPSAPRALDIGVGLGKMVAALERAGFETQGIEPSSSFHARLDGSKVQLASAETAEFPPDSFDFITFGAVLEHLYSPSLVIERALRWLKPGGIIHAEVPSARHLIAKLINIYFRVRGVNYVTHLSPMHPPYHLFEFEPDSFRKNGLLKGYEVAEQHYMVCAVSRVPLKSLFRLYMDKTNTGMQLVVYLRKPAQPEERPQK